jgi:hypothetical protein
MYSETSLWLQYAVRLPHLTQITSNVTIYHEIYPQISQARGVARRGKTCARSDICMIAHASSREGSIYIYFKMSIPETLVNHTISLFHLINSNFLHPKVILTALVSHVRPQSLGEILGM